MIHGSRVLAILFCAAMPTWAQWQMDTSHPQLNVFEQNEPATLNLQWTGKDASPALTPVMGLYDMLGQKLADLWPTALVEQAASLKLPTNRLGYYEIRATGDDASQIIPALGSRPAGMMTYAVVARINRDPANNWKYHYLGMQGTTILGNGQPMGWDMYPYLGIQTAGIGYQWSRMEPTGPQDFDVEASKDKAPHVIREMNIYPFFILSGYPLWAVDMQRLPENQRQGRGTTRLPPRDYKEYEAYLRRMVTYIKTNYSQLPHRTYEILWEPCIPWGWYGTKDEIVKVFEVANRVIHELDPTGRVAGPTISSLNDTDYLDQLLVAGMSKYIDVLSCHPYKGYPPEKTAVGQGLADVDQVVRKRVGRSLPFIGTEFGFTDEGCGGALNHSYGITTSMIIFKAGGAQKHTIFYLSDYAGEPGYGFMYNLVPGMPFGPKKVSPKPAIPMIRACIDQIGMSKVVGKLDYLGSDLWGYIFEDQESHELLAAIWDASDQDRNMVFDTGKHQVTQIDGFGNAKQVTTRDGLLNLSLSRMPTYIRGISSEIYGPNRLKPLVDTQANWIVPRGKELAVQLAFTRAISDKPVTLTFDTDGAISQEQFRKTLTLQLDKPVMVTLPIATNAPLGPSVGYLRITSNGKTLWRGIQHLEITPELLFGPITAKSQHGTWQVTQTVRNVADLPWQGTVSTRVDDRTISEQKLAIAPGEQMTLTGMLPTDIRPTKVHPVQSIYASHTGTQLSTLNDVTCMTIQPVRAPVDWSKLQAIHLTADGQNLWKNHPSTLLKNDADLSAVFAYGYDEKFVYVQALVHDDVQRCETRSGTTWDQDSLQLAFDVLPGRAANSNLLAETNERTNSEFCVALTQRGPEIYVHVRPGGSSIKDPLMTPDENLKLDITRDNGTTCYRLVIAWSLLDPLHQRQGNMLGIAAAVNDSDAAGKFNDRKALCLFGGITSGKNPEAFGKALLEPR